MTHTANRPSVWRRSRALGLSLAGGLLACFALLGLLARPAWASPAMTLITVNPGDSIQLKIDGATAGDTLLLNPGHYTESFTLNKAVSLTGVSSATVILTALPAQRVITVTGASINPSVVISGLTFTGGDLTGVGSFPDYCGGGIQIANSAHPLIANVIITGNAAGDGGGLCALFTTVLSLSGSQILSNTAVADEGGGLSSSGAATVTASLIQNNVCTAAGCDGGGLYVGGPLALTSTQILSNTSQGRGGGIRATSTAVLSSARFQNNTCLQANCSGGGLEASGAVTATNTVFMGNSSGGGGGGAVVSGVGNISGGQFQGNLCTQTNCQGGGLLMGSNLTLSGTQILTNTSLGFGGGLRVFGTAVLTGTLFQGNACTGSGCRGGGLSVDSLLTTTLVTFTANSGASGAGAIQAFSPATLNGGLFQANQCTLAGCSGGALGLDDDATLSGTTVLSNSSQSFGGAYYSGGVATIIGGLFQGNQCLAANCDGGALFSASDAVLTSPQFLSNTAQGNGGGARVGGTATVLNGLFTHNQCANTLGCGGGALYVQSGLVLTGTQFISNVAHANGGAVMAIGASTLTSALFRDNACTQTNLGTGCVGGGLYSASFLTLSNTQFLTNTAMTRAGGVFGSSVTIIGGLFQANTCTDPTCFAGGLLAGGPLQVTSTQFLNNVAPGGSGAIDGSSTVTLTSVIVRGNSCSQPGCQAGGVRGDRLVLSGTQILTNTAQDSGGGAVAFTSAALTGGLFQGNTCSQAGCQGGAVLVGSSLAVTDTQFISNTAVANGGAASVGGTANLNGGLFRGNRCTADFCQGGGLYLNGALALSGTQFLTNTSRFAGGGIYAATMATLAAGRLQGNACTQSTCEGGGVYVFPGGSLTLTDMLVLGNQSVSNGAGVRANGAVVVTGGTVQGNQCSQANCSGGGLYASGALNLTGAQFIDNRAGLDGGGAYAAGAADVSTSLFQANQCTQDTCRGGGLYAGATLAGTRTQFVGNLSRSDGAGAYANGAATLSSMLFQSNACSQDPCNGGGLFAVGTLNLTSAQVLSNTARSDGGGVFAGGNAVFLGGVVQGNACTQDNCQGGGLYALNNLTLTGVNVVNNTARFSAGGAYANAGAAANVTGGLFQGNQCTQTGCRGGGLNVNGSVAITGTQFLDNRATFDGGGLRTAGAASVDRAEFRNNVAVQGAGFYHGGSSGSVVNTLFAHNIASGTGNEVYVNGTGGTLNLIHDTLVFSVTTTVTPAVTIAAGTLGVTNTIFDHYNTGILRTGGAAFEDYNLFSQVATHGSGDVTSGAHSLSGNADFKSPLGADYHLFIASIAINAGTNAGVTIDFEGQARPQGGGFDIGYDETQIYRLYLPFVVR